MGWTYDSRPTRRDIDSHPESIRRGRLYQLGVTMRERITRGDYWIDLIYGYGKLQRVSHILSASLPESVKRRLTVNPDISDADAFKDVPLDEILNYRKDTEPEIVRLVIQNASDWD